MRTRLVGKNARLVAWGANLKRLRNSVGMTQVQFADFLGVRQATVSRWEAAKVAPNDDLRYKIIELFHTTYFDVFPPVHS